MSPADKYMQERDNAEQWQFKVTAPTREALLKKLDEIFNQKEPT